MIRIISIKVKQSSSQAVKQDIAFRLMLLWRSKRYCTCGLRLKPQQPDNQLADHVKGLKNPAASFP